jgi:hypothetical protein
VLVLMTIDAVFREIKLSLWTGRLYSGYCLG